MSEAMGSLCEDCGALGTSALTTEPVLCVRCWKAREYDKIQEMWRESEEARTISDWVDANEKA